MALLIFTSCSAPFNSTPTGRRSFTPKFCYLIGSHETISTPEIDDNKDTEFKGLVTYHNYTHQPKQYLYNKAVLVQQRNKQDAKEQHDTAYMQVAR
jgi:hypothetical protein